MKKQLAALAALALCLVLLPVSARAEDPPENAVAMVVRDGYGTAYETDLGSALGLLGTGGTVTLLKDVAADKLNAFANIGDSTLDLNGHALSLSDSLIITADPGRTFVIRDSGSGGSVTAQTSAVYVMGGGALELRGGSFRGTTAYGLTVMSSTLRVYDGVEITGGSTGILLTGNGPVLELSGGTISGVLNSIYHDNRDVTARSALAAGRAYFDERGNLITEDLDARLSDFGSANTFLQIGPCTHSPGPYTSSGDGTHKVFCTVCGETMRAESCQYEYSDPSEAGHTGTCQLCGHTEQLLPHRFGGLRPEYGSGGPGVRTTTLYRVCGDCGYRKTEGVITYPGSVEFTYGETPTVTATSTLPGASFLWELVDRINQTNKTLSTESSCQLPADLSCAGLATLTLWVSWDGDGGTPSGAAVDLWINPAPLPADKFTVDDSGLTYDGKEKKPTVLGDGLREGTDYTVSYSDNINAGTGTVILTGMGNYAGQVTKPFSIAKAKLEADTSGDPKATGTYGQKLSELSFIGLKACIAGTTTWVDGTWRLIGDEIPDVGSDGLYTAYFTPDEPGNFDLSTPLTYENVPLDIEKARHRFPIYDTFYRRYGSRITLDLSADLSDLKNPTFTYAGASSAVKGSDFDAGTLILTFDLTQDRALTEVYPGGVIQSDNHQDIPINLMVKLTEKIMPEISAGEYTRPYNGRAVQLSEIPKTAINPETGEAVSGQWELWGNTEEMIEVGSYFRNISFIPNDLETYQKPEEIIGVRIVITEAPPAPPVTPPVKPPVTPSLPTLPKPPELPEDTDTEKARLTVETGISEVPESLRSIPGLSTPAALEEAMTLRVTALGAPSGNTAVYDVTLLVSHDGGRTWEKARKENFPADGRLTVTLPYPAGTDASWRFTVAHMFTTDYFGKTPGQVETPAVTNTAEGLRFTVTGLSPISVGWTAAAPSGGGSSSGGASSSGGGGGSSVRSYAVTVEKAEGGRVTSSRSSAAPGATVTLTAAPDSGYALDTLTVTDSLGVRLRLTEAGDGAYRFTMPARAVTVRASFVPASCDGGAECPSRRFADLDTGAWYHEAVDYALRNGLMSGYGNGTFGPDNRLTRVQFARILYNQAGCPAVSGGSGFPDVPGGGWRADAVSWAASQGIVSGYGDGRFRPDGNITREQLAVMLWRRAGSPAAEGELQFTDAREAGSYAREALLWAVEKGILSGYSGGGLRPKGEATRAHAARMLARFLEEYR